MEIGATRGVEWGAFGEVHLAMEEIDALDAEFGGAVHDGFDGHLGGLEVPIRIRRDGELGALAGRGGGRGGGGRGGGEDGWGEGEGAAGGE